MIEAEAETGTVVVEAGIATKYFRIRKSKISENRKFRIEKIFKNTNYIFFQGVNLELCMGKAAEEEVISFLDKSVN